MNTTALITQALNALGVIVHTPALGTHLEASDPQASRQVRDAFYALFDYAVEHKLSVTQASRMRETDEGALGAGADHNVTVTLDIDVARETLIALRDRRHDLQVYKGGEVEMVINAHQLQRVNEAIQAIATQTKEV